MARPGSGARAAGDIVRTEILPDPGAVAIRAAERIAQVAREAVAERGRCALALSGGTTPWRAFSALAGEDVPWERVHLFQVDERVAPSGDPERNDLHLKEALIDRIAIPSANVHSMPVEEEDLDEGARRYEAILRRIAGTPPVLDLVQLGLGEDGHTASLFPGRRGAPGRRFGRRRHRPSQRTEADDPHLSGDRPGAVHPVACHRVREERQRWGDCAQATDRFRRDAFVATAPSSSPTRRPREADNRLEY